MKGKGLIQTDQNNWKWKSFDFLSQNGKNIFKKALISLHSFFSLKYQGTEAEKVGKSPQSTSQKSLRILFD